MVTSKPTRFFNECVIFCAYVDLCRYRPCESHSLFQEILPDAAAMDSNNLSCTKKELYNLFDDTVVSGLLHISTALHLGREPPALIS